jgi:hypothetical protein
MPVTTSPGGRRYRPKCQNREASLWRSVTTRRRTSFCVARQGHDGTPDPSAPAHGSRCGRRGPRSRGTRTGAPRCPRPWLAGRGQRRAVPLDQHSSLEHVLQPAHAQVTHPRAQAGLALDEALQREAIQSIADPGDARVVPSRESLFPESLTRPEDATDDVGKQLLVHPVPLEPGIRTPAAVSAARRLATLRRCS